MRKELVPGLFIENNKVIRVTEQVLDCYDIVDLLENQERIRKNTQDEVNHWYLKCKELEEELEFYKYLVKPAEDHV